MDQSGGRARGRARGRGRSQQQQQQQQQQSRRPGDLPPSTQATANSSRASHHPSAARDGTGDSAVVARMSSLTVSSVGDSNEAQASSSGGTQPLGRGATRGRRENYQERTIDVTRPAKLASKIGTLGTPINLITNYFSLIDRTSWSIKQHCVTFDPPEDNTRMRKKLLRVHQKSLGDQYIFDGAMLFLEKSLPEKEMEFLSKRETDGEQVRVIVKFVREVPPSDYTFLHIFSIITNQCMSLVDFQRLKKMDRDYFDVKAAMSANNGVLEIWPGFRTSVAQHERDVLMCVAVSHKVLRTDTVLDLIVGLQSRGTAFQDDVERCLLGTTVMCRHNNRTYRVDDVLWDKTPLEPFEYRGNQVSLLDYYKQRYNIVVTTNQPLICSRPKKREMRSGQDQPFWLIPELCCMTGLSDDMRNNFGLMKELSGFLNMPPHQRVDKLRQFSKRLNSSQDVRSLLTSWGLKFSNDLMSVNGRILAPEEICTNKLTKSQDGSWADACKTGMRSIVHLERWMLFYSSRCQNEARTITEQIIRVAKGFGMNIAPPKLFSVANDRVDAYVRQVNECLVKGCQLVMCVIASKEKTKYDALKQLLVLRKPVPSQIVTGRLIRTNKNIVSVATKIAIQINCKLGGVPWEVKIPLGGSMVIGYDTYHESERRGASAGAWVSSLNKPCTRYFSCATIHSNREELCSHMEANMHKSLEAYHKVNDQYPQFVFMYRDGVGEGQIRYVRDVEVASLKKALAAKSPKTKLTFIIVTKTINTRFFVGGGRINNPPPGTLVDDVVTLPQRYDFYLVSQKTRIGAVTPVMYNIILDECEIAVSHMQSLTFKLSHLYYNMSSTVRVPAPCHYAHRLAFLVGQSLHQEPHAALSNTLFFL